MNGTVKIEKWTITRAGNTTRISGPTTTAKKRESLRRQARAMLGEKRRHALVDWTEVDEVLAKVQKLKPVGDPTLNSAVTSDWQDANRDRWGRPKNGNAARWGGGNCLRACLATVLGRRPEQVPDPRFHFGGEHWLLGYNDELERTLRIRLEEVSAGVCEKPRIGVHEQWIAALTGESASVGHAVVCRAGRVVHDPAGGELDGLEVPKRRLYYGLKIVPANIRQRDRWGAPV